jgi:hypothetical protein
MDPVPDVCPFPIMPRILPATSSYKKTVPLEFSRSSP